jgi:hypothetical protein
MPRIHVLKPFVFSRPATEGRSAFPRHQSFAPGNDGKGRDYEIDDAMAKHPWIAEDFADGAIERPEDTQARLIKEKTAETAAAVHAAVDKRLADQAAKQETVT